MTSDIDDLVARWRASAASIRNDGTPAQVGLSAEECDEAATALEAIAAERDEAHKIARELTKAIVGLTPGGSEYFSRSTLLDDYFADTKRCVSVIRERYDSGHRAKSECADLRKSLSTANAEVERLRSTLSATRRMLGEAEGTLVTIEYEALDEASRHVAASTRHRIAAMTEAFAALSLQQEDVSK